MRQYNKITQRKNGNRKFRNRKIILCMLAVLALSACSGGNNNQTSDTATTISDTTTTASDATTTISESSVDELVSEEGNSLESKSLEALYQKIESEVELPAMVKLADQLVTNMYGVNLELLDEYVFYGAEDIVNADTIILIKKKEESSSEEIKEALTTMIEHKKKELENYLPEQYNIVKDSEVIVAGEYIYLIISEDKDEITDIVTQYLQ